MSEKEVVDVAYDFFSFNYISSQNYYHSSNRCNYVKNYGKVVRRERRLGKWENREVLSRPRGRSYKKLDYFQISGYN